MTSERTYYDSTKASFEYVPVSEEAKSFIQHLHGQIRSTKPLKRERADAAVKFHLAVERFISNLIVLCAKPDGAGWMGQSMKKEAYTGSAITYRHIETVVNGLTATGLLTREKGIPAFGADWDNPNKKMQKAGEASKFKATTELVSLLESFGISLTDVPKHFRLHRDTIELRGPRGAKDYSAHGDNPRTQKCIYTPTARAAQLKQTVEDLNSFLSGFKLSGGSHSRFYRIFNECTSVDDYGWNKGGRLYSDSGSAEPSYQALSGKGSEASRQQLKIDNEATVEIDISASYLTIFHSLAGEPLSLPTGTDPYTRIHSDRSLAKDWMKISFGKGQLLERWPPRYSKEYREKNGKGPGDVVKASQMAEEALQAFPSLSRLEAVGLTWADLMFVESEVIIGTMRQLQLMDGVPSYPVFDSLIVPVSQVEVSALRLIENFCHAVGVVPLIKTDSPIEGVKGVIDAVRNEHFERWKLQPPNIKNLSV